MIPVAPTELTATLDSKESIISLSWTDNSTNETGFKIEQKIIGGTFSLIGETRADVTTFISGVKYNTDYVYRVYAYNDAGKSLTYTNEASAKIATALPTVITEQPAAVTTTSAVFKATVNAHNLPTRILFEYRSGDNPINFILISNIINGGSPVSVEANSIGLKPASSYIYRIKATNDSGTSYGEWISFDTFSVPDFKIGQNYGGGIIFYIDNAGQHGLIAATTDQNSRASWYTEDYNFNRPTASSIGTGHTNTATIVNFQGNTGIYAAKICKDYRGGNYSDWFLPSKEELILMYQNRSIVGSFTNNYYWSSTEDGAGSDVIFIKGFGKDQSRTYAKFYENFYVRAIRAF